ncbi:hypothetical protein ACFLSE_10260 [Bacteroidota bacterium]
MKKNITLFLVLICFTSFGQELTSPYSLSFIEELKHEKYYINPRISPDKTMLLHKRYYGLAISNFDLEVIDTIKTGNEYIRHFEWLTDSTIRFIKINNRNQFVYNLNTKETKIYEYEENEIVINYSGLYAKVYRYINGNLKTLVSTDSHTGKFYISPDEKYVLARQGASNTHYNRTVIYDLNSGELLNILDSTFAAGWCKDSKYFIYYKRKLINEDSHSVELVKSDLILTDIELKNKWNLTNSTELFEPCDFIEDNILVLRPYKEKSFMIYKLEENK